MICIKCSDREVTRFFKKKVCYRCYSKYYRYPRDKANPETYKKMRIWAKREKDNSKFGGNKEKSIKRDGFKCTKCGISRKKHTKKYGRDLSTHHKDKNRKNNSLENLVTICSPCHTKYFHPFNLAGVKPWNKGLTMKDPRVARNIIGIRRYWSKRHAATP